MRTPTDQISLSLEGAAAATLTELYGLGREAEPPLDEYPLAQITEVLDERTCDLCLSVHGRILDRRTPAYQEWRWPSHANCRRVMVYIHKSERDSEGKPIQPDFEQPSDFLIKKHGHFHLDPDKYAELRFPSRPEGRDFIFVRGKAGEPGKLLWRPGLSAAALRSSLRDLWYALGEQALPADTRAARYADIVGGVAERGQPGYDAFHANLLAHTNDWQALGMLDTPDYATLACYLAEDPDTWVCTYTYAGRTVIGLYHPSLPVEHLGRYADDVAIVYDPEQAQIIHLMRLPRKDRYMTEWPDFKPLRGDWQ